MFNEVYVGNYGCLSLLLCSVTSSLREKLMEYQSMFMLGETWTVCVWQIKLTWFSRGDAIASSSHGRQRWIQGLPEVCACIVCVCVSVCLYVREAAIQTSLSC